MVATHRHLSGMDNISSLGQQRVLVVDDYKDGAKTLSQLIEHHGHEVRKVTTGGEALLVASEFRPTLILLDIGLPDLDGYAVAKELRKRKDMERTVIVALTGFGRDLDRALAKESGCDHHITKPLDLQRLIDLLAALPPQGTLPTDARD